MKSAKQLLHETIADDKPQSVAEHLLLSTFHRIRHAEKDKRFAYELETWELLEIAVATVQADGRLPMPSDPRELKAEKERNKIARLIARHIKREYKRRKGAGKK